MLRVAVIGTGNISPSHIMSYLAFPDRCKIVALVDIYPEKAEEKMLREQLLQVLDTLTPRENEVLLMRYGLRDGRPKTLEEVGKEFNVTRERIRQIEAKALRKLRHPNRTKKLNDYIGK